MIFIAGATGFIGRHLLPALKEKGHRVRCLVRTTRKAELCEKLGFETAIGDITERETLRGVLEGCRMVVYLVGIIEEKGGQTFKSAHVQGTRNIVEEAKEAGIGHFFLQSALGADPGSWATYLRTKAEAEETVKASGIPFTIFRPSLVIGPGDGFTNKLRGFIKSPSPVIPVPGKGEARFQPVYIGDWIKCFLRIMDNPGGTGKVYEFGGPEHLTYNEIVQAVAEAMGVKKPLFHIPSFIARLGIRALEKTPLRPATVEQLKLLNTDNICERESISKSFGFEPIPFKEALERPFISPRAQGR